MGATAISGTPVKSPVARSRRWLLISAPLLVIVIISQIDKASISVMISNSQFLKDMNLIGRPAVSGFLVSGYLFSYSVSQVFWAYAVKKFGARACAVIGIVIWAGTFVLSGIAQSVGTLIVARVILGVGEGFVYPAAHFFVANWFPVRERARATAFWWVGSTIGPAMTGALIVLLATGGWRLVFYGLAVISLVIPLPMLLFLMRNRPRQHPWVGESEVLIIEDGTLDKTKEVPKAKDEKIFLRDYRFWLLAVAWGFDAFFTWGWQTWLATYFRTVRHFSFQSAGYIFSLSFFFAAVAVPLVGVISDRFMKRAPLCTALYLLSALALYVGGVLVSDPYRAVAVLAIVLIGQRSGVTMIHTLLHSIVPEALVGTAAGIGSAVSSFFGMFAPTVIGLVLQFYGFGAVLVFLPLAAVLCGLLILILAVKGY